MALYDPKRDIVAADRWCCVCPVCFAGFCEVTGVEESVVRELTEDY